MIPDAAILHDIWFWALGIPAVILLGLGKGGFIGVSAMAMPLMALAVSPVQAAAVLLPLMIAQDLVSVWFYRHSWDRHIMKVMLPGAVLGVGFGYLFAALLSESFVLMALGVISIIFGLHRLWIERGGRIAPARPSSDLIGVICGMASGLTSQIANAGAPPFHIWVMPQRLERDKLVGTAVLFFAAVNWIKVPAFAALGQFTRTNIIASAALLPVALAATLAGVRLVRKVDAERFQVMVYLLTILLGVKLLWDGASQLAG